ncbi:glycosyltransferase family 2 protein [Mycobacterium sp. URHB0044]|uniref:glycosyltransferase family 2 protein n=1 Tax=Mycobacterium sp. URHB0044 TaxID=1380386 RepID=UPI000685181B|nr:glycosyltransferase family 2 protein [Mycobacterium sp. URHB0044]
MEPAVSIIMPVRNVQATLGPAVRSIVAQTWKAWELVILDDGSTDGTVDQLRAWADLDDRIRPFVDGRSLGISARLNEGVLHSRASIIARMDGDDICYPHRLETQLAFLRENSEVDVVGAGAMVFTSDGTPRGPRSCPGGHEELTANPMRNGIPLAHPTWMGRRSWFQRFPYDPCARGCEDWEILLRGHTSSRYASLPDVLLGYREDQIKLRRSVEARLHQVVLLMRYGARHRRIMSSLVGSGGQLAKGVRDTVAVIARRQDLVLVRRNRVPSPSEISTWNTMWAELTGP